MNGSSTWLKSQVFWVMPGGPAGGVRPDQRPQAAFAARREDETGSLEPGKLADFAVLDANPLDADPERIPGIGVLATVVGGSPVHESAGIFAGG